MTGWPSRPYRGSDKGYGGDLNPEPLDQFTPDETHRQHAVLYVQTSQEAEDAIAFGIGSLRADTEDLSFINWPNESSWGLVLSSQCLMQTEIDSDARHILPPAPNIDGVEQINNSAGINEPTPYGSTSIRDSDGTLSNEPSAQYDLISSNSSITTRLPTSQGSNTKHATPKKLSGPYTCTRANCRSRPFNDHAGLLRHNREVHGEASKPGGRAPTVHPCPHTTCKRHQRGFPRHWNLLEHMKRMHGARSVSAEKVPSETAATTQGVLVEREEGSRGDTGSVGGENGGEVGRADLRALYAEIRRQELEMARLEGQLAEKQSRISALKEEFERRS